MRIFQALRLPVVAAILSSIVPSQSFADSWMLPTKTTYRSGTGHARITITPRVIQSQLDYFKDKAGKVDPAGQKEGEAPFASARLERLVGKHWHVVWEHRIANEVAPVWAIVRDDGEYAVTFDDWHGMGYGPNAVVIYGARGDVVRALALSDVLPAEYIGALPHSVSSIHWRGNPRFSPDGQRIIIPVVIPSGDFASDPATIDIAIDLAEGNVAPINPTAWTGALAKGQKVLAAQIANETAAKTAFLAPLLGPKINTEIEWHGYLREAVGRLIGDDETPSTTVLRLPGANDYAVSETWIHDALTESYADKVALVSLSEPNLVTVLEKVTSKLPDGSLSNLTVFVAVSDQRWPQIVSMMQRTGAKLVQLDPAKPLPQRPERIAQRYGS